MSIQLNTSKFVVAKDTNFIMISGNGATDYFKVQEVGESDCQPYEIEYLQQLNNKFSNGTLDNPVELPYNNVFPKTITRFTENGVEHLGYAKKFPISLTDYGLLVVSDFAEPLSNLSIIEGYNKDPRVDPTADWTFRYQQELGESIKIPGRPVSLWFAVTANEDSPFLNAHLERENAHYDELHVVPGFRSINQIVPADVANGLADSEYSAVQGCYAVSLDEDTFLGFPAFDSYKRIATRFPYPHQIYVNNPNEPLGLNPSGAS